MNWNRTYLIPALAVLLLASAAIAQTAGPNSGGFGPRGPGRTPPTAEQMAARRTQMCADMQARGVGKLAYLEARLNLTPSQRPLFQAWKSSVESQQATQQADCAKPRPARDHNAKRPTLPERNARTEEMLKARLATLEKMRPAQEALYNALSPDQQKLFERESNAGDRMAMMHRGHHGFGGRRFARGGLGGPGFGPGGRGPGFGPGGRGPGAPGPNSPT